MTDKILAYTKSKDFQADPYSEALKAVRIIVEAAMKVEAIVGSSEELFLSDILMVMEDNEDSENEL